MSDKEHPELDEINGLIDSADTTIIENRHNIPPEVWVDYDLRKAEIKTQQLIYKQLRHMDYWLEQIAQRIGT